jgi:3-(3-hydroxy-phenyl)propionate hydroxylase
VPVRTVIVEPRGVTPPNPNGLAVLEDDGLVSQRFDAQPGTTYLLRPDQHICARWRAFDAAKVRAALARATCNV